jgi:hypothetical protein
VNVKRKLVSPRPEQIKVQHIFKEYRFERAPNYYPGEPTRLGPDLISGFNQRSEIATKLINRCDSELSLETISNTL